MASGEDAEIRAAAAEVAREGEEEDIAEWTSITDDEASLVEDSGILSREELINKAQVAPYPAASPTVSSATRLTQACAAITRRSTTAATPHQVTPHQPARSRSVVTLRAPSVYKLAAAHLASVTTSRVAAAHLASVAASSARSASPSAISAAATSASSQVAILDSGATHHLWPFYKAFIHYHRVYGQFVTLADNSRIRIAGRGTIAVEMGGKRIVIRDVYHVPDLRLPLFSLRVHRRVLGCGYHSNNDGVSCFFPTFQVDVDDEVDTYVTCRSIGPSNNKRYDYIQPRASASSAAAGSVPRRRSPRLRAPSAAAPPAAPPTATSTPSPASNSTPIPTITQDDSEFGDGDEAPPTVPAVAPPVAPPTATSTPSPAASPAPIPMIAQDDSEFNYEDDKELSEDSPKVDVDTVPSRPRHPRLQAARINPAALEMLSGALDLLTPADPPQIQSLQAHGRASALNPSSSS